MSELNSPSSSESESSLIPGTVTNFHSPRLEFWYHLVLVRAPQRNRTNWMCIYKKIYYTKLAHAIINEEVPRSSGSVSWQAWAPGKANISVWVQRQEKAKILVWKWLGGRILSYSGGSAILCYSDLQLIGWGPLRLRRAICLVSLWTKVLISSQTSSQKHLEQCLAIYLSVLWPIKLTHQISYPSFQPHVFIIQFNPSIPCL